MRSNKLNFKRTLILVLALLLQIYSGPSFAASSGARSAGFDGVSQPRAKWCVMVFMNADNDLDRAGIKDICEMERAGVSNDVNILVQIDRAREKTARRYLVSRRAADAPKDDWGLVSTKIEDLGEVDMGDHTQIINFSNWCVNNYPAEKYALIIWNHGAGWRTADNCRRGISYDEQSGKIITAADLGLALEAVHGLIGKPVDMFGMDACLMQMIEVAYELRENASYIVASEETEPGDGWPYDPIFSSLLKNPEITAPELSKLIAGAYSQSYMSNKKGTTMSVVDTSYLPALAAAVDEFSKALLAALTGDERLRKVKICVASAEKFEVSAYIDLGDFIKLIIESIDAAEVKEAGEKVLMALSKTIIMNSLSGTAARKATGLAIYFPRSTFNQKYSTLNFSSFAWDEMVNFVISPKL
jgi:hypothetical protein